MLGISRKWMWGAIAAGVTATGVATADPPTTVKPTSGVKVAPATTTAAVPVPVDPLGAMLTDARAAYAKVRDYSCTFTRQERVNGVLGAEQVGEMRARSKPYSVSIRFARPDSAAGMEIAYVAGRREGKIRFRPAGAKGVSGLLTLAPDDPKYLAENRHPASELGIGATLDLLGEISAREAALRNPVEVFTADYQFAGRNVTRYEVYTRRAHTHRYAYKCVVFIDKETKLPLRFEAYDAPKPGLSTGDLLEAYSYTNVKLNVGLGDSAFDY